MSDSFHDAHRPDNKPKGFGWWNPEKQRALVERRWELGDRDAWLVFKMFEYGHITRDETRELLGLPVQDQSQPPLI